ncbi:PorT family protein [Seonamhaeicola sp. MEBiC1930]|uniref:hypothetical protein n=1 Tax=Seonamhaeicola sp. MEBiC01930 TaxID=2976768 RepID=UPI0032485019
MSYKTKIVQFIILLFLGCFSINGQSKTYFGVKGGLNLTFFKVSESNFGFIPGSDAGYYTGAFCNIKIDETYSVQPEVLYILLNDFEFLNVPFYVKYEMAHGLNILIGPSINYFFDFFSNKLKIRADLSTSYNITKNLDFHVKYALGFKELTPNSLFLGIGYRI